MAMTDDVSKSGSPAPEPAPKGAPHGDLGLKLLHAAFAAALCVGAAWIAWRGAAAEAPNWTPGWNEFRVTAPVLTLMAVGAGYFTLSALGAVLLIFAAPARIALEGLPRATWGVQLLIAAALPWLFFTLKSPAAGLAGAAALLVALSLCFRGVWRWTRGAALMLAGDFVIALAGFAVCALTLARDQWGLI